MTQYNDSVDSKFGENEFMPFRNIVNEWTARDTSKKVKSAFRTKALNGEHFGSRAPYGYIRNKEQKKLYIDEETAPIVKRIFQMCIDGKGPLQIAKILKTDKVLTPEAYEYGKTGKYASYSAINYPYHWSGSFVAKILANKAYIGCVVNAKTYKPSYKNKHVAYNMPENHIVVPNMHESIIDNETFEIVQNLRNSTKKRPTKQSAPPLFSGIVKCGGCAKNLGYRTYIKDRPDKKAYSCSTYTNKGKDVCTIHHIRSTILYELVLADIQKVSKFAAQYESEFIEMLTLNSEKARKSDMSKAQKELAKVQKRITELDGLFKRIYEDNYSSKLSDERFIMLSNGYDWEQTDLKSKEKNLQSILEAQYIQSQNTEKFMSIVTKYTDIQELTPTILHELIEKVVVHEADKSTGTRIQKVDIYYNFVGIIQPEG